MRQSIVRHGTHRKNKRNTKNKIGFIKYEVKGAYTKTVILAKGLGKLNSTL